MKQHDGAIRCESSNVEEIMIRLMISFASIVTSNWNALLLANTERFLVAIL